MPRWNLVTRRGLLTSIAFAGTTRRSFANESQATATPITILNQSSVDILQPMVDALQTQLDNHFLPIWGKTATLTLKTGFPDPVSGEITCLVQDYMDISGLLGYHFCQTDGTPYVRVFARSIEASGQTVSAVLSHELMELLANPMANSFCLNDTGRGTGSLYNLEVCDPVQQNYYDINGFTLSNFVTPRFYLATAPGPYDFLGTISAPFTPAPGGRLPMKPVTGLPSIFG